MATTYVPTTGIHAEELPTVTSAASSDGMIINSGNKTLSQIPVSNLMSGVQSQIDELNTDIADKLVMPFMYYRGNITSDPDEFMSTDDSGIYYANNYSAVSGASNWGYLIVIASGRMTSQFFIDSTGSFFWRVASGNPQVWYSWNQGTSTETTALQFLVGESD